MYDVSASTLLLNRYRLQLSLWIGIGETLHLDWVLILVRLFTLDRYRQDSSLGLDKFLSIGETLHLDQVSARPFTLDRYWQDPSLGLGIGETLHLNRISLEIFVSASILPFGLMSASFGLLIDSLRSDDKF
ncbi:hypothetical protein RhiirA1_474193 [Rhizophagus irregularis]|uniref:Uncharacterized protein n=1 Tax=Rhizophagus irregularis TaxID=588596 RepID=A0A2I1FCI5_9GLOM|nr:hypothetical protein RhiirA1_474193 [Rhizophagus irregularis]PKY32083.1 hypothetical protein RhiirB3_450018 [Rhizophagus irregularis]